MARRVRGGRGPALTAEAALSLTCSANTLRFADLPTRCAAAANAGFDGIGLRLSDYTGSQMDDAELHDLLDRHALRVLELEHIWDWSKNVPDQAERDMFRLADRIGLRQLNAPLFAARPLTDLALPFGALCDRAADHGVEVGLEFMPYSAVRTVGQAWQVVEAADRRNGGVILDLWHWFRSGAVGADLVPLPNDKVTSIQLGDVLAQPETDQADEARHRRVLPGQGAGDTAALLGLLNERGAVVPVSVEVFSDSLDSYPASIAASLAYDAAADVLCAAGLAAPAWSTNLDRARDDLP